MGKYKFAGILMLMISVLVATNVHAKDKNNNFFKTNVPNITENMLQSEFWTDKIYNKNKVIMTKSEIEKYNRQIEQKSNVLVDLKSYKEIYSKDELENLILNLSTPSKYDRYDKNGKLVTKEYYDRLNENLNLKSIKDENNLRYGITVRRTEMRKFPTYDRVFSKGDNYEFDRFMETAVYPIEPLVILGVSKDKKWYFAQMYNYLAWIPSKDVAVTSKKQLFDYVNRDNFITVISDKAYTVFNEKNKDISQIQLDMGVRIPLEDSCKIQDEVFNQDITGNYVITLPRRKADGTMELITTLISRNQGVCIGYLPYTAKNIINQSFKFLGERYGWGGMFNARDCSSFIMDIYRSMGIKLPRNTGEQSEKIIGKYYDFSKEDCNKRRIFNNINPGAALYLDGHAMLYLGKHKNKHYMIHDFSGFYKKDNKRNYKYYKSRQVMVTPVELNINDKGETYKDKLYGGIEFILNN